MITLLLTVFLVVLISAICSMTEAALYSVPWTYIENLRKQGATTGEILYQLRSHIDQPIAAVLTLNTVANTGRGRHSGRRRRQCARRGQHGIVRGGADRPHPRVR